MRSLNIGAASQGIPDLPTASPHQQTPTVKVHAMGSGGPPYPPLPRYSIRPNPETSQQPDPLEKLRLRRDGKYLLDWGRGIEQPKAYWPALISGPGPLSKWPPKEAPPPAGQPALPSSTLPQPDAMHFAWTWRDDMDNSLLMYACRDGDAELVRLLLAGCPLAITSHRAIDPLGCQQNASKNTVLLTYFQNALLQLPVIRKFCKLV